MPLQAFDLSQLQTYHSEQIAKALEGPKCVLCLDPTLVSLFNGILRPTEGTRDGLEETLLSETVKEIYYTDGGNFDCPAKSKV